MEEETLDIRRYIDILLRWWWLLLLGPLVAGVTAYLFSIGQTPRYEATTLLMVQQTQGSAMPSLGDLQLSRALASTYQEVILTRPVLEAVAEDLSPSPSIGFLRENLKVSLVSDTSLLRISAMHENPAQAAAIANTLAEQFTRITQERQLLEIARVQSAAASQGIAATQDLLTAQLSALTSLRVVEPAVPPTSPIFPKVTLNTILGILLGGVIALAAVLGLEYLNDTTRIPEEVERRTGLTRISAILKWPGRDIPSSEIVTISNPRSSYAEGFRQARTNVQFLSTGPSPKRYLVTSPGPGTGKTTFAANLAAALAQEGKRVRLVDADLRRPGVHRFFSLDGQTGLSTYLANPELDPSAIVQPTPVEGLSVVTSGPLPPNPIELVGSQRMETLLQQLAQDVDIVLVDSPPVMVAAESAILASRGMETIMLIDPSTRVGELRDAQRALAQANAKVLGFVLNKLTTRRMGYGYYYHYYHYYQSYNHDSGNSQGHGSLLGRLSGVFRRGERA